jgi:hypothetical protein
MKGYPLLSIGASRVGLMPDGSSVVEPDPDTTLSAVCVATVVVSERSIVYVEVDGKFASVEHSERAIAAAMSSASEMCMLLADISVPWRIVAGDVVLPPDVIADFPSPSLMEAVARVVRGNLLNPFAASEWQGEDALHVMLRACETLSMNVVKVFGERD